MNLWLWIERTQDTSIFLEILKEAIWLALLVTLFYKDYLSIPTINTIHENWFSLVGKNLWSFWWSSMATLIIMFSSGYLNEFSVLFFRNITWNTECVTFRWTSLHWINTLLTDLFIERPPHWQVIVLGLRWLNFLLTQSLTFIIWTYNLPTIV